ncbi:hypothetical protein Peur_010583 [Populus x canadensis]
MYSKTRNRGLAFVTMGSPEEADAALNNLESYVSTSSSILPFFGIRNPCANLPFEAKSKDLKEFFIAEGADVVSAEVIFQDNPKSTRQFVKHLEEDGSQSDGTSAFRLDACSLFFDGIDVVYATTDLIVGAWRWGSI